MNRFTATIALVTVAPALALTLGATASLAKDAPDPAALEKLIPQLMTRGHVPGLSIAVIRNGEVAWDGAFGVKNSESDVPVSPVTIFEGASFTKPVFAYCALKLVEEGTLDLDKPLVDYVSRGIVENFLSHNLDAPEFRADWFNAITARHVLSHSSGMPHGQRGMPMILFFEPGSEYRYSAWGYFWLQIVVEQIKGEPLQDIVHDYVLEPLGMTRSAMIWRDDYETSIANGHTQLGQAADIRRYVQSHAAASLYTTARDYARFVCAVLNDEGLKSKTVSEMLSPQVAINDTLSWAVGFGLQKIKRKTLFWQWGDFGIFRNFVIADKKTGDGVVYLTNSFYGLSICDDIVGATLDGAETPATWLGYPHYDSPIVEFLWTIAEDGVEPAIERLPALREQEADMLDESAINGIGYALMFAERVDDAITLLEFNVKEYPESANVYDSLGEAHMTRGNPNDIERAIALYKRVLEVLPGDPNASDDFKRLLQRNAREKLTELESMRDDIY